MFCTVTGVNLEAPLKNVVLPNTRNGRVCDLVAFLQRLYDNDLLQECIIEWATWSYTKAPQKRTRDHKINKETVSPVVWNRLVAGDFVCQYTGLRLTQNPGAPNNLVTTECGTPVSDIWYTLVYQRYGWWLGSIERIMKIVRLWAFREGDFLTVLPQPDLQYDYSILSIVEMAINVK